MWPVFQFAGRVAVTLQAGGVALCDMSRHSFEVSADHGA